MNIIKHEMLIKVKEIVMNMKCNRVIENNENTTYLINFLKRQQTNYPTLSKDEERAMIDKYRNDREKLNKLLFMHNIKLVFKMSKKYMSKTNDFDTMVQDGMLGLMEAATRFDINKNIKFCTYAYMWIMKYMTMRFYDKQNEIDKRSMSLNSLSHMTTSKDEGNDNQLEDYVNSYVDKSISPIKTIENELSSNEQQQICKNLMRQLNDDNSLSAVDKQVFVDLVYNREKPRDVAFKYDISLKDVTTIRKTILEKFKNILTTQYQISRYADIA